MFFKRLSRALVLVCIFCLYEATVCAQEIETDEAKDTESARISNLAVFENPYVWKIMGPFLVHRPGEPTIYIVKAEAESIKLKPTIPVVVIVHAKEGRILHPRNEFIVSTPNEVLRLEARIRSQVGKTQFAAAYELVFSGDVDSYQSEGNRAYVGELNFYFPETSATSPNPLVLGSYSLDLGGVLILEMDRQKPVISQYDITTEGLLNIDFENDINAADRAYEWWADASKAADWETLKVKRE